MNPSNNPKPSDSNNNLYAAQSQAQVPPVRSRGYYDSPSFQPPFLGEKPGGWFGTNHLAFASNQQSELDKNKLAAMKTAPPNR